MTETTLPLFIRNETVQEGFERLTLETLRRPETPHQVRLIDYTHASQKLINALGTTLNAITSTARAALDVLHLSQIDEVGFNQSQINHIGTLPPFLFHLILQEFDACSASHDTQIRILAEEFATLPNGVRKTVLTALAEENEGIANARIDLTHLQTPLRHAIQRPLNRAFTPAACRKTHEALGEIFKAVTGNAPNARDLFDRTLNRLIQETAHLAESRTRIAEAYLPYARKALEENLESQTQEQRTTLVTRAKYIGAQVIEAAGAWDKVSQEIRALPKALEEASNAGRPIQIATLAQIRRFG